MIDMARPQTSIG